MTFFTEQEQTMQKFIWSCRRHGVGKAGGGGGGGGGGRLGNKARGITLSDFRKYYRASVIQAVRCWYKNRDWISGTE